MYSVAMPALTLPQLFTLTYGTGSYSSYSAGVTTPVPRPCAGGDPVANGALMTCNAGARTPTGDVTPPLLTWELPAAATTMVTAPFTVSFSASDDTAVTRLELYKNLELVAVLSAPPYSATIDATPGEQLFVTVEALDAAANRATLSREFTAAGSADLGSGTPDMARPASPHARGCSFVDSDSSDGNQALLCVCTFLLCICIIKSSRATGWGWRAIRRR
jgi:hypothetical protein